ncbi:hypothetical protein OKW09_005307 [Pseudomonas rhodesiae]|nr:hypothetical protein [Pseudomonas rhodesiae]MDF9772939.1 hypothetical protein [Pseudomonas rhodesiae]
MLPVRVTGSDVAAACKSLGIANDGYFELYDVEWWITGSLIHLH